MQPDGWPARELVSEEFDCTRVGGCEFVPDCWTGGRCMSSRPDPKGAPRRREPSVTKDALLAHRECVCCGEPASDGHHVLFKSNGGDDVIENIAPLTHIDHMMFHAGDRDAIARIGEGLLAPNVEYVIRKLGVTAGVEYLRWRYGRFVTYREARRIIKEKGPWDAHHRADT